jgi:hypothetical protein
MQRIAYTGDQQERYTMKHLRKLLIVGAASMLALGFHACERIRDTKETISSAEDFANSETEFAGAFDISDDLNGRDPRLRSGAGSILPSGAVINWLDSSFTDGDAIEYSIDFGPLGSSAPFGRLCGDGRFRAGVFSVTLDRRYTEIGATGTLRIQESDGYYSGDGITMTKISGNIAVTRKDVQKVMIVVTDGMASRAGKTWQFSGTKEIENIKPGAIGILGDEFKVTGSGAGVNKDGVAYTWNITQPLIKRVELGCARTFISGIISLVNSGGGTLSVDFDPDPDPAGPRCDRKARATINGKTFDFEVQ